MTIPFPTTKINIKNETAKFFNYFFCTNFLLNVCYISHDIS